MSDAISGNILRLVSSPAAQSATVTESGMLIMSFLVLTPVFIAAAVGAGSGVWPLVDQVVASAVCGKASCGAK
jgi:hypothetical protein